MLFKIANTMAINQGMIWSLIPAACCVNAKKIAIMQAIFDTVLLGVVAAELRLLIMP